jgi:tetratricopeptide (TPR) repeat protein
MKIGPYEVLGELGRGGMGIVYRVRTPSGAEAALKLVPRVDPPLFSRFDRERRLMASLGEAEGFVGLLDAGHIPGSAYLLMPLVPGGTLRQRLEKGPLGIAETLSIGLQVATSLGAAHARGIVHRDVKPENVLFTAKGRALVADLGLAKHFDRSAPGASQSASMTREGTAKGTVGYMAPEQIEDAARAGPAADVFALGAVLYECLAGRAPFQGGSVLDVLARVSSGIVPPLDREDAPRWLTAVVLRALARDAGRRFQDGAELANALREGAAKEGGRARRSLLVGALALGAVAAVALAGVLLGKTLDAPPPAAAGPGARDLVAQSEERRRARDWDAAIVLASRALDLDATLAAAWASRTSAKRGKSDWDGTIADATRALELDPKLAQAWDDRASARGEKGDWDGALVDASRALEVDPGFAMAWADRGAARCAKGDWERGLSETNRAIALDPKISMAWANRGNMRVRSEDWDGAIEDLTKAIDLDPKHALDWATRSVARAKKNDWIAALSDASRAIELDAKLPNGWFYRAAARAETDDTAGAIADFRHYLELVPSGPNSEYARAMIDELGKK